eukprot:scaffold18768_cov80-Cyclotella_meneghiniana.AAC.9
MFSAELKLRVICNQKELIPIDKARGKTYTEGIGMQRGISKIGDRLFCLIAFMMTSMWDIKGEEVRQFPAPSPRCFGSSLKSKIKRDEGGVNR